MAQHTTAADLAARIDQARLDQQVRNRELAEARQVHSVKTRDRQTLMVEAELDGTDHSKRLTALDRELAGLGQTIEQKAAALAHMPAVLEELQRRHRDAAARENVAARQTLANSVHADVDTIKQLFEQARVLQQRAARASDTEDTLRRDSAVTRNDQPAASLVRDGLSPYLQITLPQ